jgi:chromosomal replication initiator protein
MLTKEKIESIHALLDNEVISADEYAGIVNVLNKNGNRRNGTKEEVRRIISAVADYYDTSVEQLLSREREPKIVRARQVAMYISQKRTNLPSDAIADEFGRDYSAVVHAKRRIAEKLESDKRLKMDLELISERLGA